MSTVDYGIDNVDRGVAAFLARKPIVNTSLVGEASDLAEFQRNDEFLCKLIKLIKSGLYEDAGVYLDECNEKWSKSMKSILSSLKVCSVTDLLVKTDSKSVKIVIPKDHVGRYLTMCHDSSGHGGFDVSYPRLRGVWWPSQIDDLKEYCRTCLPCARRKGRYGLKKPKPGVCEKGEKPFQVIFVDYIQLPMANSMKYALTLVCSFSRFLRVYPSRGCSAEDTSRALAKFVEEFGVVPRTVHSDRGTHFVSKVFQQMCRDLQITQKLHVSFRPESSGLVERIHRTLKSSLFITCYQLKKPWTSVLSKVVLAINSNVHSATKVSPFKCVYGRENEVDQLVITESKNQTAQSHGQRLADELKSIHKAVNISNVAADNAQRIRQKQVEGDYYNIGDKVLIWRQVSRKKVSKEFDWIGPFTVTAVLDLVLEIKMEHTTQLISKHHSRLVPERSDRLKYDNYYDDVDICVVKRMTDQLDVRGGGGGNGQSSVQVKIEPTESEVKPKFDIYETTKYEPVDSHPEAISGRMDPGNDVTVVEQVSNDGTVSVPYVPAQTGENISEPTSGPDSQASGTSETPVAENPEQSIFNVNGERGGANLKSVDISSEFDSDTTLQNTAIEVGQPVGKGATSVVKQVATNNGGNVDGDVNQVSRTHSCERELREDNEENTVLASATPKKIFNMNDDSIFDSPKSSSTPHPKRGRPRQNRNNYNPDISASNGLRQTLDHLIKTHSPARSPVRRSGRSKNEIDRFGNPVDHTKKKKKQ